VSLLLELLPEALIIEKKHGRGEKMIIDAEVVKVIGNAIKSVRKLSKPLNDEEKDKFFVFYEAVRKLVNAKNENAYTDEVINSIIQMTARYGDPVFAGGLKELSEFLRKLEYRFEDFGYLDEREESFSEGGPVFYFYSWKEGRGPSYEESKEFIEYPDVGVFELLIAYILEPGESRSTFYNLYDEQGTKFVLIFGKTKGNEVYCIKAKTEIQIENPEIHEELKKRFLDV